MSSETRREKRISTEPSVEPVTTTELKSYLRIDSTSLEDDLALETTIAPGAHVVAASYSLIGSAVEVLGYDVLVHLVSAANGASGTVDVKLQESDDASAWTDVTSGAFTQVTEANDNAVQEKAYTGTKRYLRAVSTVTTATCSFAVTVTKKSPTSAEDVLLASIIKSARRWIETQTGRALITQTWYNYFSKWPAANYLPLWGGELQSVTSVIWYDDNNTATAMVAGYDQDYIADTSSGNGRIVLPAGASWPYSTLYPVNPIHVLYVCGYGDTSSAVPDGLVLAVKMLAGWWYENRNMENVAAVPAVIKECISPYTIYETL